MKISQVERNLYDVCYVSPRKIFLRDEKTSQIYARVAARRHAHTAKEIINYGTNHVKSKLKILNASGLQTGHQTFSICHFLRQHFDLEWDVFESPDNPYLESPVLKKMLRDLNINCQLANFAEEEHLYGNNFYDIVIFTEIAEHLEHSTFLRALAAIYERLKNDGILILTTPNLASIANRIKLLLGNDDLYYWGDDLEYVKNSHDGCWGHITYYGLNRLRRLLSTCSFKIGKSYSFNYSQERDRNFKVFLWSTLSQLVKNSKCTLFIVAKKNS